MKVKPEDITEVGMLLKMTQSISILCFTFNFVRQLDFLTFN